MTRLIDHVDPRTLEDYEAVAHLAPTVRQLREEAGRIRSKLRGRTVWMVNSTAHGGGVAEMLPTMVSLLRELGFPAEWVVIDSDRKEFFALTKTIHNLIHGAGEPELAADARELYEATARENAGFLAERMDPRDILIVHDPQPMALATILRDEMGLPVSAFWRCHIGLDEENPATRAAWQFLRPYCAAYRHAVFSAPEYIPDCFAGRSTVIHPAINPISEKNRELSLHKLVGVLANSALSVSPGPLVPPPFGELVQRLQADGQYRPANTWEDIGLLTRPIVTQVSRWDRLKGWRPLLDAFVELKRRAHNGDANRNRQNRRRLDLVRLVLAGPDPKSIEDDPEGKEVMAELHAAYLELDPMLQDDIALVTLPMSSPRHNALIVNALQRASTLVVQNSLREGFGLTVTEAMWKRVPILTSSRACGPRQQVRDGIDGRLIPDPEDSGTLATVMEQMLGEAAARDTWGRSAQRRVHDEFLVFSQIRSWLRLLDERA